MICDGEVTEGEVAALKRWLAGHPDAARLYPGKTVAERLLRIYADGVITPDERQELNELLLDLTGETEDHDQPLNLSTRLPFDEPTPTILSMVTSTSSRVGCSAALVETANGKSRIGAAEWAKR